MKNIELCFNSMASTLPEKLFPCRLVFRFECRLLHIWKEKDKQWEHIFSNVDEDDIDDVCQDVDRGLIVKLLKAAVEEHHLGVAPLNVFDRACAKLRDHLISLFDNHIDGAN